MYSLHNTHFKPPRAQQHPQRSPSPPHSYVEPLSPSAIRPRPIEPNFYYPALNNHGASHYATNGPREGNNGSKKRGHHRISSSIDTLADAASAVSPNFIPPTHQYGGQSARVQQYEHTYGEPPHKRTRSEMYPAPYTMIPQVRPQTSYNAWPYNTYNTRVEEAALLLNFSTTGGKPAAHQQHEYSMYRPHANSLPSKPLHGQHQYADTLYNTARSETYAPRPETYVPARPTLPSPQRTSESKGPTPEALHVPMTHDSMQHSEPQLAAYDMKQSFAQTQQIQTPPEEPDMQMYNSSVKAASMLSLAPKKRGWPKGKPRGPSARKQKLANLEGSVNKRPAPRRKKVKHVQEPPSCEADLPARQRRHSFDTKRQSIALQSQTRYASAPPELRTMVQRKPKARRQPKAKDITICAGCNNQRVSTVGAGELDEWISCDACKQWYHVDCAGFRRADVRDVDKYFCKTCEPTSGKTTWVRKSTRAHASVDYAELQKGVLKTSEESTEHHYIQSIKDGTFTFDADQFPRIRPELLTRDFLERSGAFTEPICVPAEWNTRPWAQEEISVAAGHAQESSDSVLDDESFEYDCVLDNGQDKLDMVMPKGLTVRTVSNLVGPETPLDVIDVKTQNSGGPKWNLARWADYYESNADDKPVRNVISLEVSQTKLGRLLRRPKVVREIDLQDQVWPQDEIDKGKWPKVQYYCLMSIADSYTDFHIDFGGSSVYYHVLKGKKTFFFIPPKPKHLKAYEEWNENPQQNFTFLPDITGECYRVDLKAGDTMLIPSGWIHAVWTPETSLVIGGNFLTHMNFRNQFKVAEIEKNNETPLKFRYPFFQRLMWYTAIHYMQTDPMPEEVSQILHAVQQYERERPIWQEYDDDEEHEQEPRIGSANARYYSEVELDGLPELVNFVFRTVMIAMGRVEGITADRIKRVNASIPKGHGEPLEIAKAFALWVAWKRGNEKAPAWALLETIVGNGTPPKLNARAIRDLEKKEATAAATFRASQARQSRRVQRQNQLALAATATATATADAEIPVDATTHADATLNFDHANAPTTTVASTSSSLPSPHMFYSQPVHQEGVFTPSYDLSPPSTTLPATVMTSAFQGQHISTPKTSVLGPKRVACDACRRRRIRCKHKDYVVQAMPDLSMLPLANGLDSIGASGDSDMMMMMIMSQTLQDDSQSENTHDETVLNNTDANGTYSSTIKIENNEARPAHALGTTPGTNAYVDANIPMTLNGVALFGDAKRGRSKACFECRKSKRRCIHDEEGNVDPVKAAETPVPRASPAVRKRQSEDSLSSEGKKVKIASAAIPPQAGVLGVLRPANYKRQSPIHSEWSSASPVSDHMLHTPLRGSTPNSHIGLPIDPSLTSTYPEPIHTSSYADHYSYSASSIRPGMISLPSLEEIATEVLDMDGGAGPDVAESDLMAIHQFNQHCLSRPATNTEEMSHNTRHTIHSSAEQAATHLRQNSNVSIPIYHPPASNSPEVTRATLSRVTSPTTPRSTTKKNGQVDSVHSPSTAKIRHTRNSSGAVHSMI